MNACGDFYSLFLNEKKNICAKKRNWVIEITDWRSINSFSLIKYDLVQDIHSTLENYKVSFEMYSYNRLRYQV